MNKPTSNQEFNLLSVDLGLKTAFACFDKGGRVFWLQSRHFSSPAVMRRGISALLTDMPVFHEVLIEGGGNLAKIWMRELELRSITPEIVQAEKWRADLLYPREQRSGGKAKETAHLLASEVLEWSNWKGPSSNTSDAAEAILSGFWYMATRRGLAEIPPGFRSRLSRNSVQINQLSG
jgi:hypothetical protein